MKNFKSLIIVIVAALGASSCAKLKETPKSFITAQEFYKTPTDAANAVTACYYWLNNGDASTPGGATSQTPYNVLFSTGMEMMTDDIDPGPGATNPDVRSQSVLQHNSSGLRVLQIWQFHYAAIRDCNIAIDSITLNIHPNQFTPRSLRTQYIAEAHALRALWYFNLVRLYGAVPLVLHDQDIYSQAAIQVSRNPVDSVYAQIIRDLTWAADSLPGSFTGANVGRVTSWGALSLLSKVYLTMASFPLRKTQYYELAATTAEKVINSGAYALQSNYSFVFLPQYKNNNETILAAQFKANSQGQGNGNAPRGFKNGVPGYTGSYADQLVYYPADTGTTPVLDPNFSMYKLYQKHDQRKKYSFVTNPLSPTGAIDTATKSAYWPTFINSKKTDTVPFLNKYFDPSVGAQLSESGANVHVIRYAEVLLIAAEAENEANGPNGPAYNYINEVRTRAGIPNLTLGLSQVQFRDSVYLERRLELVWEWQRWFDLIREIGDPSETPVSNPPTAGPGLTFAADETGGLLLSSLWLVGKISAAQKHYLYPIPLQEIQLNPNLTQNPGW